MKQLKKLAIKKISIMMTSIIALNNTSMLNISKGMESTSILSDIEQKEKEINNWYEKSILNEKIVKKSM